MLCTLGSPAHAQSGDAPAAHVASAARVLKVGPQREIRTLATASRLVRDGDTVEIDAGDYLGDVAVWTRDQLTLRAVGGTARLVAAGAHAEGKAIWVMRGGRMTVENIEFTGSRVPDRNGAGIRLEKGLLRVVNCRFLDNQNGILTSNDPTVELVVEGSEFSGPKDESAGIFHNLYAGTIRRLTVIGSYSHHARTGHLLKSRAAENHILYNRLTDEADGQASYELEFPNGGLAYVIGNIIQQSGRTQNPHLVAYGAEGYKWPRNELHLAHNTLVDDRPGGGAFLRVAPGATMVRVVDNLLLGSAPLAVAGELAANPHAGRGDVADAGAYEYRLKAGRVFGGKLVAPGTANEVSLAPTHEYAHPRQIRALGQPAVLPGAQQTPAP